MLTLSLLISSVSVGAGLGGVVGIVESIVLVPEI